jgi:hypothetical protein
LRAGYHSIEKSVSPVQDLGMNKDIMVSDGKGQGGVVDWEVDDSGIDGERLGLREEEDCIRKLEDPSSPNEKEVEDHYLMGHQFL